MRRSSEILGIVGLIIVSAGLVACEETADEEDDGESSAIEDVYPLFEPTDNVGPMPTDLWRDDERGELDVPVDPEDSEARQAFFRYLDGFDGVPLTMPIRIPMSAPVDEESLSNEIYLIEAGDDDRLLVDAHYDGDTGDIVVEPDQPLEPETTYRVGLRGYEDGIIGAGGEMVVADPIFELVRADESPTENLEAVPGSDPEQRQQRAELLQGIQQDLQPVFDSMSSHGVLSPHLAVAFEFTTTGEPAVRYDRLHGEVPVPNDLLVHPVTGRIELPVDDSMSDEEREIRDHLSRMDGFSISGAMTVDSTHYIADGQPSSEAFRLFEYDDDDGEWVEVDDLERGRFEDGRTGWLRPELTLEPETEYVYVVTDDLESNRGRPHRAQPLAALTRFDASLVDDGGDSQLEFLSDDKARRLESVRRPVDEVLERLETTEQFDRSRVAAAVPFTTAASASSLLERRAELYERDVSTEVANIETTEPWEPSVLFDGVDTVVHGEMTVLDHIEPESGINPYDRGPVEREVKFSLTLPEVGTTSIDKEVPVVLFGHGLVTSRELLYLIAGELASAGYAAFAVDLPYHGSRAVCLNDDSCQNGASCGDDGQCRDDDGNEVDVKTFEVSTMLSFLEDSDFDDLLNYPITSGQAFIDMENLVGTRDAFAQGVLDLNQAVRVIQGDQLQEAILPNPGHNLGDEILYLGMSLGGILGTKLTAVEPEIENFVLNVPSADVVQLIEESATFESIFEMGLDDRGIEQGSDEYFEFIDAARWIFDPIDPLNHAQYAVEEPIDYVDVETGETIDDRQARVLIQMAEGDLVVPNEGTRSLSERMNVGIDSYDPSVTDHAFLFDPTSLSGATRQAREDILDFYEAR